MASAPPRKVTRSPSSSGPVPYWVRLLAMAAVPLAFALGLILDWDGFLVNLASDLVILGTGLVLTNLVFYRWQQAQFYQRVAPTTTGALNCLSLIADSVARATAHCGAEITRVGEVRPAWAAGDEGRLSELDRSRQLLKRLQETYIPELEMAGPHTELQVHLHDLRDAIDAWASTYESFLTLPGKFHRMGGRWMHAFEPADDVVRFHAHKEMAEKAQRVAAAVAAATTTISIAYRPKTSSVAGHE